MTLIEKWWMLVILTATPSRLTPATTSSRMSSPSPAMFSHVLAGFKSRASVALEYVARRAWGRITSPGVKRMFLKNTKMYTAIFPKIFEQSPNFTTLPEDKKKKKKNREGGSGSINRVIAQSY